MPVNQVQQPILVLTDEGSSHVPHAVNHPAQHPALHMTVNARIALVGNQLRRPNPAQCVLANFLLYRHVYPLLPAAVPPCSAAYADNSACRDACNTGLPIMFASQTRPCGVANFPRVK